MSKVPLVFAIDVSFIDGLLKRLIDQLAAIPTIVGILSLIAAAVIMANTVSADDVGTWTSKLGF